MYKEH